MKPIKLILLVLSLFVFNSFFSTDAIAQKKNQTVTEITTASPVFYFIYVVIDEEGKEVATVELQIYDRKHQFVSMGFDRLNDQARGNDPKNPLIKIIQMPEIDLLAFRQVESLEEALLPVDGKTVLQVRHNALNAASRIIINNR